ncbi:MAG: ATP phosphoribosyltransferase regulatory subunit [Kiritimatiellae bacterium]|nr:ATP phosphoribosyltransferase regulatory subunit [Kiritimatiellia bacterium]
MSSANQPVQGMSDITMPEVQVWQGLERVAREVLARYGFEELRTPVVEFETVFTRSIGETTDVVQKEMYVFEKGGRRLCLRPEGTAGVMRYAAGLGAQETDGARWFYIGPMFRSERPQAGRRRQFHQLGIECLEPPSPRVDAEILALQVAVLNAWGLADCTVKLATRGGGMISGAGLRDYARPSLPITPRCARIANGVSPKMSCASSIAKMSAAGTSSPLCRRQRTS